MAVSENDLIVGPLVLASGVSVISLDFYFEREEWLEVYKSGSETPLVLSVDYTVSGEGTSSGSVTLTAAANGTDNYSVYLAVPLERSSDMQLRGEFKSGPFNLEMDRIWQRLQYHWTVMGRTLRLSKTSQAAGGLEYIAPGQFVKMKDDGTGFIGAETSFSVSQLDVWFQDRGATSAAQAAELADGSILSMAGLLYRVDSAAVGPLSATNDLGVNGLRAWGRITPEHFGATGDGVTDDSTSIQAAIDSLGDGGGTVHCAYKYAINADVTIKAGVTLRGDTEFVGTPGNNTGMDYSVLDSCLRVASDAVILCESGASIVSFTIYRQGMSFPESDASLFQGTAIASVYIAPDATTESDGIVVDSCTILGFFTGVRTLNADRLRMNRVNMDCWNCVDVETCYDVAYLNEVHCWPFVTISDPDPKDANWADRGTAFKFYDVGDWTKATDCFCYGYATGYHVSNVNSVTLLSCSADGTTAYAGSIGFNVESGCTDVQMIACQAAGQVAAGYRIDADLIANLPTRLTGCDAWGITDSCVLVDGGDVLINGGGIMRNATNGVAVNNSASSVFIDDVRFSALSGRPLNCFVVTDNVVLGDHVDFGTLTPGNTVADTNMRIPSVGSAASINLRPSQNFYNITGSVSVDYLNSGWAGRRVTLKFANGLTLNHGTGGGANPSAMVLAGGAAWAAPSGATIEFIHDGYLWYETNRRF